MARALARSSRAPRAAALTVHPIATTLLRQVGTPEFMAPEIVDGAGHGTDADWWSLGVMLCEMLTLATPFRDPDAPATNHESTYANIVQGRFVKPFEQKQFKQLPKNTASLISGLLKVDPQERLGGTRRGPESIRTHPFFWGLSWEALEARELTPPHAEQCGRRAAAMRAELAHCPTELQLGSAPKSVIRDKDAKGVDAAAAALDKLFDFSEW